LLKGRQRSTKNDQQEHEGTKAPRNVGEHTQNISKNPWLSHQISPRLKNKKKKRKGMVKENSL
jgi:hypothetical protein